LTSWTVFILKISTTQSWPWKRLRSPVSGVLTHTKLSQHQKCQWNIFYFHLILSAFSWEMCIHFNIRLPKWRKSQLCTDDCTAQYLARLTTSLHLWSYAWSRAAVTFSQMEGPQRCNEQKIKTLRGTPDRTLVRRWCS